ncbi:MAG TPA: helix-turn-helix transcriptional regulator [Bacteriovoracaceae bacterium]|nr:helix-turn-helix transcriptional regulator [Bacteriovoracaceae bacterium]
MRDLGLKHNKISELWKAGRLLGGKTQVELSRALHISQSSISKYETLGLEPSATDWYNFCQFVGIDAHKTLQLGYIDGKKKFKHRLFGDSNFRLPLRYKRDFSLKIRELIPFKECLVAELGLATWLEFLTESEVDKEMFLVYDYQVSLDLLNDLISWCDERDFSILERVQKYSGMFSSHGILHEEYARKKKPSELLMAMLEDQVYYHRVFRTEVTSDEKSLGASLQVTPEAQDFFDDSELSQFLHYKIMSFQQALRVNLNYTQDFEIEPGADPASIYVKVAV